MNEHDRSPNRRRGPMTCVMAAGMGALALVGASEVFNFKLPLVGDVFKAEAKGSIQAQKPRVLKITQNVRVCVADVEAAADLRGQIFVEAGIGPAKTSVKAVDNTVHVKGDFATCAQGEDVDISATINPTDPSANSMDVLIRNIYADRTRITNLGEPGSVEGGISNRMIAIGGKVNGAELPGILQKLGEQVIENGLCEPEVMPFAKQGFQSYYEGIGKSIGIPEGSVRIAFENLPAYESAKNARERGQQTLGRINKVFADENTKITLAGANCASAVNIQTDSPVEGQRPITIEG